MKLLSFIPRIKRPIRVLDKELSVQWMRGLQILIGKSSKQHKSNFSVCQFYKPIQQIAKHIQDAAVL